MHGRALWPNRAFRAEFIIRHQQKVVHTHEGQCWKSEVKDINNIKVMPATWCEKVPRQLMISTSTCLNYVNLSKKPTNCRLAGRRILTERVTFSLAKALFLDTIRKHWTSVPKCIGADLGRKAGSMCSQWRKPAVKCNGEVKSYGKEIVFFSRPPNSASRRQILKPPHVTCMKY